MKAQGLFQKFEGTWLLDGLRTPMVDCQGAFADANPIDHAIKAAKALFARSGVDPADVDSVLTGNMAPGRFDQFYVARHTGLYAGVPPWVPALNVQRICGTGFELFRQAGEQIATGGARLALLVGTESMTRNPISAFGHRGGFKLGAGVGFKDDMWEALSDPAAGINMIQTAENMAQKYGVTRVEVDAFAAGSFAKAVAAQAAVWFDGELVPVGNETFELEGLWPRSLRLSGKAAVVIDRDTHPRPTVPEHTATARAWGRTPLGRVAAAAVVGVPPEIMGIGPAPAIRLLLDRSGLQLANIASFEINEAQAAQTLAVTRELDLDPDKLKVKGGAIALGHPLAATGVRLTVTVARQLKEIGARWGVASACVGGGQGIDLLIENAEAA